MTKSRKPRIFHGLHNIAGIPAALAKAERAKGYESRSVCFNSGGVYQRHVDELLEGIPPGFFSKAACSYDIFNFHFGSSLLGSSLKDLPVLRAMGKKVFMHFHGCDVRDSKTVIEKYSISACMECWPMQCSPNRNLARAMATKYASRVFVSTPDIAEFVDGAIWLPQAIDPADVYAAVSEAPLYRPHPHKIVVAHAPTSRALKGSIYVEKAIAALQAASVPIELKVLTGMKHSEVMRAIHCSDIFIDQLLIGSYGVAALEAMLLSKPVVVYVRNDVATHYGAGAPLINSDPINLPSVLYDLAIRRRDEWARIGQQGIAYTTKMHSVEMVSDRLCLYYS